MTTIKLNIFDTDLEIDFNYYRGESAILYGDNCHPESAPEVEIEQIRLNDSVIPIDHILSSEVLEKINYYIFENAR
jgi:hypothetical protein